MNRFSILTICIAAFFVSGCNTSSTKSQKSDPTVYLFTYFTGDSKDGLHLAWSRDGYSWEQLGGGGSYLKPSVGESKLMRDPCVTLGPDGVYHMVWTTAWDGQTIGYASTRDFLHWSDQRAIPVMAGIDGTRNCWAPEIVYDPEAKHFVIFWSSTVEGRFTETAGSSESNYNHRLYFTTTTDFQTFTPPLVYDPGFSVIDGTLIHSGERWGLIIKDETVNPPKKHLRLAWGLYGRGPEGPYRVPPGPPFSRDWVEGPTAFVAPGGEVLVYFDVYRDKHYGALRTRDFETWEDVTDKISLPKGIRHGTIIPVPQSLVNRLISTEQILSRPPPYIR